MRLILFFLKFLQVRVISMTGHIFLYRLSWSHFWFNLKLSPFFFYTHHAKSCGNVPHPVLETQDWNAPAYCMFLASVKLLPCFNPVTTNQDVVYLCSLLLKAPYQIYVSLFHEKSFSPDSPGWLNYRLSIWMVLLSGLLCLYLATFSWDTVSPWLIITEISLPVLLLAAPVLASVATAPVIPLSSRSCIPFAVFLEAFFPSYRPCLQKSLFGFVFLCII